MITKLKYNEKGIFEISGTIKITCVDFETKKIDLQKFFSMAVEYMIKLKKNIQHQLADDNRILGNERVEVVKAIDKFLTLIFAFALITSKKSNYYTGTIDNHFTITIEINKTKYMRGAGRLYNVSSKDITDFENWMDLKIFSVFKNIIKEFNEKGNRSILDQELITLIYNAFCLRYKIEYI